MLPSLIAGGASIIGGLLGKPKRVSGVQSTMEAAQGAMLAQEKYGINALELIRSGSAGASSGSQPRVGSIAAMTDGFDKISDVLSGRTAQDAEARQVQNELAKIELERARAEVDKLGAKVPRAISPGLARTAPGMVATDQGNVPRSEISKPTPILPDGKINTSINDGNTGSTLSPRQSIVLRNGDKVDMTVGPDLDEILMGGVAEVAGQTRSEGLRSLLKFPSIAPELWRGETGKMNDIAADVYSKNSKKPITWDSRFGARKPRLWSRWDNKQKMQYLYEKNR